jgi:L-amino acid N-acyltransferase YncA
MDVKAAYFPGMSNGEFSVRDVADDDLPQIQAIYTPHVLSGLATFEEVPPAVDEMRARRAAIAAAGLPYLVAVVDGRVVGYCYAGPYRPRPAYRHTVEDSIYLAPGFEGRGIGSQLLTTLIARCEAGSWRQMLAIIGDSGNAPSVALHRRLGFRHVGTLQSVGFKLGRWVDTVIMQRPLGAGDTSRPVTGGG